jgi:arylformamidase
VKCATQLAEVQGGVSDGWNHARRGDVGACRCRQARSRGTHQGRTVDQVPVESLLLRPYKKFDLTAHEYAPGDLIAPEDLRAAANAAGFALDSGDIAIVETGWDRHRPGGSVDHEPGWWGANQPGFAVETCELLAGAGIVAVASDTSACDVAVRDREILSGHGHATVFLPRGI